MAGTAPLIRRFLPAAAIAAVLGVHGWLIVENIHLDGDTLRDAWRLTSVTSFAGSWTFRAASAPAYVLQGPVTWVAVHAGRVVLPWWNELTVARLFSWLAAAAIAAALWHLAGEVGADLPGRLLAVFLPFCWHGFSFLIAECDDNLTTDALRVATLGVLLGVGPHRRRACLAGAVAGLAIAWHFQSILLLPAGALALFWSRCRSDHSPVPAVLGYLGIAVAVYSTCLLAAFAAGLEGNPGYSGLLAGWAGHHVQKTGWWFFSSGRTAAAQVGLIGEGWGRMSGGYSWLRPEGLHGVAHLLVPALVLLVLAAATLGPLVRSAAGSVLVPVFIVEGAHSLFYEPENIERWDLWAVLSGLAAAAAITRLVLEGRPATARRLRAGWFALGALLAMLNVGGWYQFTVRGEAVFLDVVEGRRADPGIGLDCIGAHRTLCRAARSFVAALSPADGFEADVEARMPDAFHQFWTANWLLNYLMIEDRDLFLHPGPRRVAVRVFRPLPPGSEWRVLGQERFAYLLIRGRH